MLGVPKPTEYERILESKRLDIMGFRKRIKDRMESRQIPEIEDPNSSFVARRARKERRLLSMPIPPSAIFKDTSHLRPQPVEASMDTVRFLRHVAEREAQQALTTPFTCRYLRGWRR
jgi:hypothetical protein